MNKIFKNPQFILIAVSISILLIWIHIIFSIIKRRKPKKVLIRIRKSFTYKETRSQIVDSMWKNWPIFLLIIIELIKYAEKLSLLNSIRESGRHIPYGYNENYLLGITIMFILNFMSLLIDNICDDIYFNSVQGDIRKDGIVIWRCFYKWKRIKSYRWQDNKLFVKVKIRLLMFHWISERELEVPIEYKESIDKIIIARQG